MKNTIGSLIGIALNLQIALGSILIFTIVILPIHELIIREMQIKTTMRYHFTPVRMAINAGEGVEKREPSYTVGGNANYYGEHSGCTRDRTAI